jgi:hypothetical protein
MEVAVNGQADMYMHCGSGIQAFGHTVYNTDGAVVANIFPHEEKLTGLISMGRQRANPVK